MANTAGCTKKTEQRHQFFVIRKNLEEGLGILTPNSRVAHLVYLSKLQFKAAALPAARQSLYDLHVENTFHIKMSENSLLDPRSHRGTF